MKAGVRLQALDQSLPGMAERIHAVQMGAYAQEAALIGAVRFPPLERTVEHIRSCGEQFFGAFAGEVLAGVAGVEVDGQGVGVSSLVVAPAFQRRGVGRALLMHAVSCHGSVELQVQTASRNIPALSLYASCGFVVVRRWVIDSGLELARLRRPPYILRSARLGMRRFTIADADALRAVFADPYAARFYPAMHRPEALERWITWNLKNYDDHGFGLWALELLGCGTFVGDAGITYQTVEGERILEIGWHIDPSFRSMGYASEAGAACLAYGFDRLKATALGSIVDPANAASIKVASRVHVTQREYEGKNGPMLLFGTTAAEFAARAATESTALPLLHSSARDRARTHQEPFVTYQTVYSSEATIPMQADDLQELLERARNNNGSQGISGALVYSDGIFLQILEGDRAKVQALMASIRKDLRHENVTILREGDVPAAKFGSWKMAYVSATPEQVAKWAGIDVVTKGGDAIDDGENIRRTAQFAQDILALLAPEKTAGTAP